MILLLLSCYAAKITALEQDIEALQQAQSSQEERIVELEQKIEEFEEPVTIFSQAMKALEAGGIITLKPTEDPEWQRRTQLRKERMERRAKLRENKRRSAEWETQLPSIIESASTEHRNVDAETRASLLDSEQFSTVRLAGYKEEDIIIGFQINGIHPLFVSIGFQENDILLAIDGKACTSFSKYVEFSEGLKGQSEVSVLIRRSDEHILLKFTAVE